jgi:hypothetical protein
MDANVVSTRNTMIISLWNNGTATGQIIRQIKQQMMLDITPGMIAGVVYRSGKKGKAPLRHRIHTPISAQPIRKEPFRPAKTLAPAAPAREPLPIIELPSFPFRKVLHLVDLTNDQCRFIIGRSGRDAFNQGSYIYCGAPVKTGDRLYAYCPGCHSRMRVPSRRSPTTTISL